LLMTPANNTTAPLVQSMLCAIVALKILCGVLPFKEARTFVHTLGLKSHNQWLSYKKAGDKPDDISASPNTVYKNKGWISWRNWLGTDKSKK
jgi:hypothetical protein